MSVTVSCYIAEADMAVSTQAYMSKHLRVKDYEFLA